MNHVGERQQLLRRVVATIAGLVLVLLFARLGFWQLDRAQEKNALQRAFDDPPMHTAVREELRPVQFQALQSRGRFRGDRQILIKNVVLDGMPGFYVITPFEFNDYGPLLLVNRGWVGRKPNDPGGPEISIDETSRLIHGISGRLPRVGIRPGEPFPGDNKWPRIGTWPTTDEVAAELGRDVMPYVLLLDPGEQSGFARRWRPKQSGTSMHYGYAIQWFGMAIALFGLMAWNLRKRAAKNGD